MFALHAIHALTNGHWAGHVRNAVRTAKTKEFIANKTRVHFVCIHYLVADARTVYHKATCIGTFIFKIHQGIRGLLFDHPKLRSAPHVICKSFFCGIRYLSLIAFFCNTSGRASVHMTMQAAYSAISNRCPYFTRCPTIRRPSRRAGLPGRLKIEHAIDWIN